MKKEKIIDLMIKQIEHNGVDTLVGTYKINVNGITYTMKAPKEGIKIVAYDDIERFLRGVMPNYLDIKELNK